MDSLATEESDNLCCIEHQILVTDCTFLCTCWLKVFVLFSNRASIIRQLYGIQIEANKCVTGYSKHIVSLVITQCGFSGVGVVAFHS
jgi:hypothetical protein